MTHRSRKPAAKPAATPKKAAKEAPKAPKPPQPLIIRLTATEIQQYTAILNDIGEADRKSGEALRAAMSNSARADASRTRLQQLINDRVSAAGASLHGNVHLDITQGTIHAVASA